VNPSTSSFLRRALDVVADVSVVGSYSALGYRLRAPTFDPADTAVDLRGRVVVVTGASSGIGLSAARTLADRGATVVMVARNAEKLRAARATVAGDVVAEMCDLSDLEAVSALADRLQAYGRLDVLVHNAGLLLAERQPGRQEHELGFATHVLAPFLLTRRLTPLLARTSTLPATTTTTTSPTPARVVWVTSGGMYTQRATLVGVEAREGVFDGVVAYAQQKRAQVLLMERFAEELRPLGVTCNAMHPGWADTPGVARSLPRFRSVLQRVLRDDAQGADTVVWLACAPRLAGETGRLYLDREARRTEVLPGTRHTAADVAALWARCATLTATWLR
jgi:NAD(P)-dependent dehydrogenase (short-subunit alcohol dehydrogenase family)